MSPVCTLNVRAISVEIKTAAWSFCSAAIASWPLIPEKNESGSDATLAKLAGSIATSARLSVPTTALDVWATGVTPLTPGTRRRFAKAVCWGTAALGLANLLPLPALDGGRIVVVLIEKLRGRAFNREREMQFQRFGLVALLALVAVIAYFDIQRLINHQFPGLN